MQKNLGQVRYLVFIRNSNYFLVAEKQNLRHWQSSFSWANHKVVDRILTYSDKCTSRYFTFASKQRKGNSFKIRIFFFPYPPPHVFFIPSIKILYGTLQILISRLIFPINQLISPILCRLQKILDVFCSYLPPPAYMLRLLNLSNKFAS